MASRLLVGTRKGLFCYARQGQRWGLESLAFRAAPVTIALIDPRDVTWYAGLNHGHFGVKLHRSPDGCEWEEIDPPSYPEKPDDPSDPNPWTLQQLWALEPGGRDQPGVLWAGTIPGGLFRSENGGASWELNRPLWDLPGRRNWFGGGYDQAGIHSVVVDPRDSAKVTVAISSGGVWLTDDGGRSWSPRTNGMRATYMPPDQQEDSDSQDPHRLVSCPAQPDVLWVQHHCGVFRSGDRGGQWSAIENVPPSCFGFAVAVHPSDPETAWLVPAESDEVRIPVDGRLSVARTRDGGQSWESLGHGLPQQDAYDLVYRHGLAIDPSGTTLAMGSTTGNLWLSEDQGEHWTHLNGHLPPIYCLRFEGT
ncbi:MAG: exo-alpha-sialidase [Armatimonadetes bacterium]|nr:exo-alpha-sialidase [Armatimonadota bacterium]